MCVLFNLPKEPVPFPFLPMAARCFVLGGEEKKEGSKKTKCGGGAVASGCSLIEKVRDTPTPLEAPGRPLPHPYKSSHPDPPA